MGGDIRVCGAGSAEGGIEGCVHTIGMPAGLWTMHTMWGGQYTQETTSCVPGTAISSLRLGTSVVIRSAVVEKLVGSTSNGSSSLSVIERDSLAVK